MAGVFYLLFCRDCDAHAGAQVIPFSTAAERGKWAAAHTRGTGHTTWWLEDQRAEDPDLIAEA